ncbi:hypothetical protein P1P91_13350 [Halomonas piscis]|uniref:DUF4870 domain-containing protein n=1 Tax=Halomonas piscis TaxID=3031727 RepID=A0ABY9YY39_9GAMM|nr:hypothetical protein [Halomonas piscis]WNK19800.1 hypothetical protein P1P91_13350 [Halomonas piscis]
MADAPNSAYAASPDIDHPTLDKNAPGRGIAVIVYWLLLGSIMTVITAPIGALLAHRHYRHAAPWVQSHLQFQLRTFWLGVLGGVAFILAWELLGVIGISPLTPWAMGYAFFTVCLIWLVGRCGVGVSRLMTNRPIPHPKSPAFGGAGITLADS